MPAAQQVGSERRYCPRRQPAGAVAQHLQRSRPIDRSDGISSTAPWPTHSWGLAPGRICPCGSRPAGRTTASDCPSAPTRRGPSYHPRRHTAPAASCGHAPLGPGVRRNRRPWCRSEPRIPRSVTANRYPAANSTARARSPLLADMPRQPRGMVRQKARAPRTPKTPTRRQVRSPTARSRPVRSPWARGSAPCTCVSGALLVWRPARLNGERPGRPGHPGTGSAGRGGRCRPGPVPRLSS